MLLAGFWAYMPFEAYHTARKRQQGQAVDEFSSLLPLRGSSRFPVSGGFDFRWHRLPAEQP